MITILHKAVANLDALVKAMINPLRILEVIC